MLDTSLKFSVNHRGCPAVLPCLIQNPPTQNCYASQRRDFSIDFDEGGRSRIVHTTRPHLAKDTEKIPLRQVCFIPVWYSTKYQYLDYVKGLSFLPNDNPFILSLTPILKPKTSPIYNITFFLSILQATSNSHHKTQNNPPMYAFTFTSTPSPLPNRSFFERFLYFYLILLKIIYIQFAKNCI